MMIIGIGSNEESHEVDETDSCHLVTGIELG
jgi:hypothetical protein